MKRTITLLILTALLASLAACGGESASTDTTASTVDSTTAAPVDPLMPTTVKDFGGDEFHIIGMSDKAYVGAEEMNGSGINDALYKRDQETEDKLNVDITYEFHPSSDIYGVVQKTVMAGDHVFDLVINHVNLNLVSYATDNIVVDWKTVPHVDFSKPYWHSDIIDSLSINGKSPYAASDINITETVILLYNKQMAEDLQLGSLYDYVYDGTWTWDKLAEISSAVMSDVNGDTVYNEEDRYGIAFDCTGSQWMLRNIPSSCNQFIYKNGKDGLELVVNNEKTGTILEKAVSLFNGGGGYIVKGSTADLQQSAAIFGKGNYLTFSVSSATAPAAFNNLPFDYGFLPLPKYDEAQKDYRALSWMPNLLITNTADADMSGLVAEWMSYYGHILVRPEFYDSMFSTRFAQDEDSTKMLDIIFGNIVFDPGMNFKSTGFYSYFDDMVIRNNSDFASLYSSREASELSYIASLTEAFANFGK
ncbi:MAG: hypothetical protein E7632_13860 [Ruminococcaceae bacterium]|nr:hypothetical protein [Oscillospiraceae bacterium]